MLTVRRLKCRDKPYKVADMYGLYLLMHPNGTRYWRFDYRHAGKRGTLALGIYPEVPLKEAREKRTNAGKMLDKGLNPSAYKKLTSGIASLEGGDSFKAVADEWLAKIEAEGRATATMEKLRWLLSFAEPLIGTCPIGKLTAPDFFLTVLMPTRPFGGYPLRR